MAEQSKPGVVRVTQVVVDLHEGGYETLIADMARRYFGSTIQFSAVTLSGRPGRVGAEITPLLARYEVIRPRPGVSMILPLGVAAAIRRTRADVVHIHSGCWFKGSLAAKLAGVKGIVFTEHGREHDDPPLSRWLDRQAARRTDAVVAVSDRLAAYLQRAVGVDPKRVRTIQNGVDTDRFTPAEKSAEHLKRLGVPAGAYVVGSIGRLDAVKAYERLIDAVATMRASGSLGRPVMGIIWGDGPERAALEAHVIARGLQGHFLLPGYTDDAVLCHRILDVFALTSHSEGASVSLMESMACGVTPVVMDVGANGEVTGPALRSQVVPPGDVPAFVAACEQTLPESARRAQLIRDGRAHIVASYSLTAMTAAYESLYRELAR